MSVRHPPVIEPHQSYASVSDRIVGVPLRGLGPRFLFLLGGASALVMVMGISIAWLLIRGVGVWGINIPVGWGFAIVNFVWWIGIGHAGTLISAILLLMRQEWRTSINRFAEAMTLFAVANAGLFPLFHLGRIWKFYYILPYPDTMAIYPQWRSPLVWDVVAVLTYATVSLIFWYLGLVPDLATMRDTARKKWVRIAAGMGALGWRGSGTQWHRHQMLYLLLAGLATPLVVSVHSIVSIDFSAGLIPGWHSTIFPPYFVAGAIYSGFAMVFTIAVPLRAALHLKDLITERHLEAAAKVMLVSGLIVGYGYVMEFFTAWYSADRYEMFMAVNRVIGPYWPAFALMMLGNVLAPQLLWFRRIRRAPVVLWVLSLVINVGMWVERYVIVVTSLHRDFMPSSWGMYHGTIWDWGLFLGSLGFFTFLMLLFVRFIPALSISEIKELIHDKGMVAPSPDPVTSYSPPTEVDDEALYALVAEYDDAEPLLHATRAARAAGYERVEAYVPYPVEGLDDALGLRRTLIPASVLGGALAGGSSTFAFLTWTATVHYPWNIGSRPSFSWPSFIPLTFELSVLGGCLVGLAAFLIANRFPQPYHPISNLPGFERASRDRFFLAVEANDPRFQRSDVRRLLRSTEPLRVTEVAR